VLCIGTTRSLGDKFQKPTWVLRVVAQDTTWICHLKKGLRPVFCGSAGLSGVRHLSATLLEFQVSPSLDQRAFAMAFTCGELLFTFTERPREPPQRESPRARSRRWFLGRKP
jgi:hypothetical protein